METHKFKDLNQRDLMSFKYVDVGYTKLQGSLILTYGFDY